MLNILFSTCCAESGSKCTRHYTAHSGDSCYGKADAMTWFVQVRGLIQCGDSLVLPLQAATCCSQEFEWRLGSVIADFIA